MGWVGPSLGRLDDAAEIYPPMPGAASPVLIDGPVRHHRYARGERAQRGVKPLESLICAPTSRGETDISIAADRDDVCLVKAHL